MFLGQVVRLEAAVGPAQRGHPPGMDQEAQEAGEQLQREDEDQCHRPRPGGLSNHLVSQFEILFSFKI